MTVKKGPHLPISWDSFPNDSGLPPLVQFDMEMKDGTKITINPMNRENHTLKSSWVKDPALYYSLPYVIDEADTIEESTSQNPVAIRNRQFGKTMIYSKSGVLDKLQLPDFSGQTIKNDTVEVAILHNTQTGANYTLHYDVKINAYDQTTD